MKPLPIALLLFSSILCFSNPRKIWLDTDIMIGGGLKKDVDDGLALILALKSDSVDIKGISLVNEIDHGEKVTHKLLNWYGNEQQKGIPVLRGSNLKDIYDKSGNRLFIKTPAVEAIAKALRKEQLTIVALGPATNVAVLLHHYPELKDQIKEIVFCKARRRGMHFAPGKGRRNLNDYNFDLDPVAVELILEAGIPITCSGYEPSSDIQIAKADFKAFKKARRPGDKWVYRRLKRWNFVWRFILKEKNGFMPFDCITIGHIIAPEYFEYDRDIPVAIEVYENDANTIIKTAEKKYLIAEYDLKTEQAIDYVHTTKKSYKDFLLKTWLKKD